MQDPRKPLWFNNSCILLPIRLTCFTLANRYRGRRSRTRSPSVSRSPIRYRNRRYSRSPERSRSPVETSRYRASPRVERRRSPSQSRSPSESRSSESKSPTRASKEKSRSPSESPPGKNGLVSYGDGSPDSGQR